MSASMSQRSFQIVVRMGTIRSYEIVFLLILILFCSILFFFLFLFFIENSRTTWWIDCRNVLFATRFQRVTRTKKRVHLREIVFFNKFYFFVKLHLFFYHKFHNATNCSGILFTTRFRRDIQRKMSSLSLNLLFR